MKRLSAFDAHSHARRDALLPRGARRSSRKIGHTLAPSHVHAPHPSPQRREENLGAARVNAVNVVAVPRGGGRRGVRERHSCHPCSWQMVAVPGGAVALARLLDTRLALFVLLPRLDAAAVALLRRKRVPRGLEAGSRTVRRCTGTSRLISRLASRPHLGAWPRLVQDGLRVDGGQLLGLEDASVPAGRFRQGAWKVRSSATLSTCLRTVARRPPPPPPWPTGMRHPASRTAPHPRSPPPPQQPA